MAVFMKCGQCAAGEPKHAAQPHLSLGCWWGRHVRAVVFLQGRWVRYCRLTGVVSEI